MFDSKLFEKKLATSWLGSSFLFFEELPSTNAFAKDYKRDQIVDGTVILTDHQTSGKGQHKKKWISSVGENILVSIIFQPHRKNSLMLLTLAIALVIKELTEEYINRSAILKWPNDVLIGERKIAGILTEAVYSGNVLDRVVVGIGLNVNQTSFPPELKDKATSLFGESGSQNHSREDVLCNLLSKAEVYYRLWAEGDRSLIKKINKNLQHVGEQVTLFINGEKHSEAVKLLGANERGELLVLNKEWKVDTFSYEQIRIQKYVEKTKKPD